MHLNKIRASEASVDKTYKKECDDENKNNKKTIFYFLVKNV